MASPPPSPASISVSSLPVRGWARQRTSADGLPRVEGNHALALLHLIARQGQLDIRVTPGEAEILRQWPRRRLQLSLRGNSSEDWAAAAVQLLRDGPPPAPALPLHWLALAAFLGGFVLMAILA